MVELISEVDKNDDFLGLREREDFYSEKYIHRAAQLILLNSENKMLIQKRSPQKRWYPNRYTYSEAVLEELHGAVKTEPKKYTPSLRAGIIKIFQEGYGKYSPE